MGSYPDDLHARSETVKYWQNYLADCEPCFFPQLTDGVVVERHQGVRQHVNIDVSNSEAMMADFCALHDVTIAGVLQTAWAVILSRYIGTEGVCFGVVIPTSKGEKAFTVSRAQLGNEDPISQVLSRLQKSLSKGLPHASYLTESQETVLGGQNLFNSTIHFWSQDELLWKESLSHEIGIEDDAGVGMPDPDSLINLLTTSSEKSSYTSKLLEMELR